MLCVPAYRHERRPYSMLLSAWVVQLNVFVKIYTSSDMENKSIFKAGANADAGARKFEVAGGRNDERFGAGGFVRNSEAR